MIANGKLTANEQAKLSLYQKLESPVYYGALGEWIEGWEDMTEREQAEIERYVDKQFARIGEILGIDKIHQKRYG
jgi:allantoicase